MTTRPGFLLAIVALLLATTNLQAHNMPQSAIMMDFGHDAVEVELILPLQELELSFKEPLLAEPATVLEKHGPRLDAYLREHVNPVTPDGKPWTLKVEKLELQIREQPFDLIAHLRMTPPPGNSPRKFRLNYSVINHEVMSHCAIVTVRSDWDTAVFSGHPENLGMLQFMVTYLDIDRSTGGWTRGFSAVFKQGMRHISEGTDHLLFLLVLLLPAPLTALAHRWSTPLTLHRTIMRLLKIVTGFTLGHSLTLAIAGFGLVNVPSRPVEVLIAFSILISALHAIRPMFPGKEVFIASGFGLVHGLAFASTLSEFGFTHWYMALTILAFNLGIEVMQLFVVACVVPWLVLFSRVPAYKWLRLSGATFAIVASLGWIAERALGMANPFEKVVDASAGRAGWIIAAVACVSIVACVTGKRHRAKAWRKHMNDARSSRAGSCP